MARGVPHTHTSQHGPLTRAEHKKRGNVYIVCHECLWCIFFFPPEVVICSSPVFCYGYIGIQISVQTLQLPSKPIRIVFTHSNLSSDAFIRYLKTPDSFDFRVMGTFLGPKEMIPSAP